MIIGLSAIAMAIASVSSATPPIRQDRQDTIYVLHGEQEVLEAFRKQVGNQWTGGTEIEAKSNEGLLKYWAYSDRTAAESRAFMMPAIFAELKLDFESYDEAKSFPVEREKLDLVAVECGAKVDPFFITPLRSVEITVPEDAGPEFTGCLSEGVRQVNVQLPLLSSRKSEETN